MKTNTPSLANNALQEKQSNNEEISNKNVALFIQMICDICKEMEDMRATINVTTLIPPPHPIAREQIILDRTILVYLC